MKIPEDKTVRPGLFSINSDNVDFAARQNSIFEQLNVAELNRVNEPKPSYVESDSDEDSPMTNPIIQRQSKNQFFGQKNVFKTPKVPLKRALAASRIPDHLINPHKWTKYSLEDVTSEHMSERANTTAALSFLKELANRKEEAETDMGVVEKKIVFQKSVIVQNKLDDDGQEEKMRFRSTKVIMPEYVVGQKIKFEKKKRSTKAGKNVAATKLLKLDHLMEEEDDADSN